MSAESVLGAANGTPSALAAAERIQQLQTMIAQVELGSSGSFAAALQAAQDPSATTTADPSASASAYGTAGTYPQTALPSGLSGANPYTAAYPASAGTTADAADASPGGGDAGGSAYAPLIDSAAARYGVDPSLLYGLIQQESGFNPSATSSAGAQGLTQLMPSTAASLGVSEPLNPAQSIEGGARYLSQLLKQFGGNASDALAAYNAGPGAVEQYGGVPPYAETQQYVTNVLDNAAAYQQSAAAGSAAGLATAATTSAGLATAGAAATTGGAAAGAIA
jgi:soluble lytic murein transglycosylase-like protein